MCKCHVFGDKVQRTTPQGCHVTHVDQLFLVQQALLLSEQGWLVNVYEKRPR